MGNSLPHRLQSTLSLVAQVYLAPIWKVTLTLCFMCLVPNWGCTTGGPGPTPALSVLPSASAHSKVSPLLKGDRKTGRGDFGIVKFS